MIALFWLLLALSVSPFKSKNGLAAENAALRHQIDCAAAEGARSRSTHECGSPILGHAISMVSIGPQGYHDHPAGDPGALAPSRLPSLPPLAIPPSPRPTPDPHRISLTN